MKVSVAVACVLAWLMVFGAAACAQTPVATLNIDPDTLNLKSQG